MINVRTAVSWKRMLVNDVWVWWGDGLRTPAQYGLFPGWCPMKGSVPCSHTARVWMQPWPPLGRPRRATDCEVWKGDGMHPVVKWCTCTSIFRQHACMWRFYLSLARLGMWLAMSCNSNSSKARQRSSFWDLLFFPLKLCCIRMLKGKLRAIGIKEMNCMLSQDCIYTLPLFHNWSSWAIHRQSCLKLNAWGIKITHSWKLIKSCSKAK